MTVKMRGFREYTPLGAALKLILERVKKLPSETVAFDGAAGRVLAVDVFSKNNVPPFDRSAVDGFAVRASDTFGSRQTSPRKLEIAGETRAGVSPETRVSRGKAVKIMTGSPIPKGSDAVVMVEHTRTSGKILDVFSPVTPGKNVSAKGEDACAGEMILKEGKVLQPHDIGMLAAGGALRIKVLRKPTVCIVATGEELVKPGSKIPPANIIDSNSYSLAAAVVKSGGIPRFLGMIPDNPWGIEKAIRRSVRCDIVLVSGGSSVGEFDLVPAAISKLGRLVFHGVSIRPGGPTAFGVVRKKPVFSLAGFPTATLVAFHMLARPALLAMQGLPQDHGRRTIAARLAGAVSSTLGRADVARVKILKKKGEVWAEPVRITGSSMLSSMVSADGFFVVPENLEGLRKGETVEVELF